ncbi:MAG: hypothetical protein AAB511_00050 [Patescibacteria group bacterium]
MIQSFCRKVLVPAIFMGAVFSLFSLVFGLLMAPISLSGILRESFGILLVSLWILAGFVFSLCGTIRFILSRGKAGF